MRRRPQRNGVVGIFRRSSSQGPTCSAFGSTGGRQLGYATKWMEPTDITVRILQDIREDIRRMRGEQLAFRQARPLV
jgi:hypothetical protein